MNNSDGPYSGNSSSGNNDSSIKKALVIAVSDYDNSSGLRSIGFCKNDGQEMYDILKDKEYDIPENRKLIGNVDHQRLRDAIYGFFLDEGNRPDDTLVFYYSGHGVPDKFGTTYLAPSDIDSEYPFKSGFSFDDLTNSMLSCNSLRVVTILDSCFSGSLKISKGLGLDSKSGEEAAARTANNILEEKSDRLKQGVGRCLLAASQGYEEAYDRQEKDHSIFTYYLLEGLKGNRNSVDDDGNVTYDTLGKFISREFGNLPAEKRPKQTPVRKGEVSGGEIVLASYPGLKKTRESDYYSLFGKAEHYYRRRRYHEALKCFDSIIKMQPYNDYALLRKGIISIQVNDYAKALECFDNTIELNKNSSDAWYYKTKLSTRIKDYKNAIEYLGRASDINPDDEKIWEAYRKVKSLMRQSLKGDNEEGGAEGEDQEQEVAITPTEEIKINGATDDAGYFCDMGLSLYSQGKYQDAIDWYDKALAINPKSLQLLHYKGMAFFELKDYEEAIKCYDKALEIDPDNEEILKHKELLMTRLKDRSSSSNKDSIDWNNVIRKEARGSNDEDLGKVKGITNGYVIVERGLTNAEKFYIPQDKAESFDGDTLRLSVSESELQGYKEGKGQNTRDTKSILTDTQSTVYVFIKQWSDISSCESIDVDSNGFIYALTNRIETKTIQKSFFRKEDFTTHYPEVQKFDSEGNLIIKWGSYGSGDGGFMVPIGIAVDSSGYVYVGDTGNNRVKKFGEAKLV